MRNEGWLKLNQTNEPRVGKCILLSGRHASAVFMALDCSHHFNLGTEPVLILKGNKYVDT